MARTMVGTLTGYTVERTVTDDPTVTLIATVGADPGRRVEIPLSDDSLGVLRNVVGELGGTLNGS